LRAALDKSKFLFGLVNFLRLLCPFISLDSAGEEFDCDVHLFLDFSGNASNLFDREDAKRIQLSAAFCSSAICSLMVF
jgi:hypothetical protein